LTEVRKEKKGGAFEVIKMDEVGMTIFERGSAATQETVREECESERARMRGRALLRDNKKRQTPNAREVKRRTHPSRWILA